MKVSNIRKCVEILDDISDLKRSLRQLESADIYNMSATISFVQDSISLDYVS